MTTKIRRGRDAQSLWFLDPLHSIHTSGLEGEAFMVSEGTIELREGDEVVRLQRGEVAFGPAGTAAREGRVVMLGPLPEPEPEPEPERWPGL
jgi:hypothetical protein